MDDLQNKSKTCRICFIADDTVVNRINTVHEKAIQIIVQEKFVVTDSTPNKLCHDCLRRLLDANYFRELVLESNRVIQKLMLQDLKEVAPVEINFQDIDFVEEKDESQLFEYLQQPEIVDTCIDCCMCNEIFLDEASVVEHCQSYHQIERLVNDPSNDKLSCKNCCLQFESREDLISHKTCDLCLSTVNSKEQLMHHRKCCNKSLRATNSLIPVTFPCCLCPTLFNNETERVEHCESTHGFIFASHIQLHTECPKCLFCDRTFSQLNAYYAHFEEPCRNQNRCKKCGRKFLYGEQLKQHNQNIHLSEAPRYECLKCTISFHSSSAYYSHNHRYHAERTKYRCEICLKEYLTPSKLKEHSHIHSNTKSWYCDKCGKGFFRKDNLKNHMRLHSGLKLFSCSYCIKTFGHLTDKKRHEWTHNGNYPIKCDRCGRGFVKNSGYEAHIRNSNDKCKARREKTKNEDSTHSDMYEMVFVTSESNQDYASDVIELEVMNE